MQRLQSSVALCALLVLLIGAGGEAAAQSKPKTAPPPPPPPAPTATDVINSVDANPDVEAEAAGKYPAMVRESLPLGQIQRAWDDANESAPVRIIPYAADRVEKIRAREFMSTTIVFPSWEVLELPEVDDEFSFSAALVKPNILRIRPKHVGTDTTVTAVSAVSGNVYAFYVRAEGWNTSNIPDVKVYMRVPAPLGDGPGAAPAAAGSAAAADRGAMLASMNVPNRRGGGGGGSAGGKIRTARDRQITGEKDPDFVTPINFDPTKLRYDFEMSGDRSLAPQRVFTDGIFTWFDYGERWDTTDLPAVYRVVDGVDTPINTRIQGHMLVAEASGAFTLRNGQRTVCVQPEGFTPEGEYKGPPEVQPLPGPAGRGGAVTAEAPPPAAALHAGP